MQNRHYPLGLVAVLAASLFAGAQIRPDGPGTVAEAAALCDANWFRTHRDMRVRIPANYVEFCGVITFPGGVNPFPGGRFPDLRIRCRDQVADDVERAPYIYPTGAFYTLLMKGQTYDLYWFQYFGIGKPQRFGTVHIGTGPSRMRYKYFPYAPRAPRRTGPSSSSAGGSYTNPPIPVSTWQRPGLSTWRPGGIQTWHPGGIQTWHP